MTPPFAEAVDPILLHLFSLLGRIDRATSATEERQRIENLLTQADRLLAGRNSRWRSAKYALVAWIDEMLVDAHDWPGRSEWGANLLENRIFGTFERNDRYYLNAEEAVEKSDGDAVDMSYVGVLLGFQGLYRISDRNRALIEEHRLPKDVTKWCEKFGDLVRGFRQDGTAAEDQDKPKRRISTATPFWRRSWIVWPWVLGIVLVGLNIVARYSW